MDKRILVGYSSWDRKESDITKGTYKHTHSFLVHFEDFHNLFLTVFEKLILLSAFKSACL